MSVCCECCVLSGRGLCYGLITRPEESYRLWRVVVCDLETSRMRRPWPTGGHQRQKQTNKQTVSKSKASRNVSQYFQFIRRGFVTPSPNPQPGEPCCMRCEDYLDQ
jgi:hypothetical protein